MPTLTLRNLAGTPGYSSNSPAGAVALRGVEVRAGVGPGPQGPPGATGPAGAGGGTLAGDVTGASGTNTVARIRGQAIAATAPTVGQVLQWNGTQWTPVNPPIGPAVTPPTITNLNPNTGPAVGGTSVVITGTNFTGATAVRFGATNATSFVVNSATQITAVSPAGMGAVAVTVQTPDGTSGGMTFTYAAALTAPIITSSNTANATEGQAFSYTITASGNPAPTTFDATGLPAWLSRTGAVVSGTPPAGSAPGSDTFTVTATNSQGTSPGVLVTVNIAEVPAGWTVTHSFPVPPVTFNMTTGRIALNTFTGWSSAFDADMTDALYDAPNPAALPVNLWAKFSGDADFKLVPFDNWGPNPTAPNQVNEWGYHSASHSIYLIGSNSTGNPIQLRLIKS